MAASSKIHTLVLRFGRFLHLPMSSAACKQLARFICCLPCLTTLTINRINLLHDDFFIDFASMAASSNSPYFMERKHIPLLDKYWPRWRELQSPAESSSSAASTNHSEVEPSQHQGSLTGLTNLPHHQLEVATLGDSSIGIHSDSGSMNPSTTYPHRAHTESIRSTSEQVDLTTRQHLDEFDRYLESYLAAQNFTHVPSHSLGHSSDSDTRQQYSSSVRTNTAVLKRQEQPTQMEPNILLPSSSSYINSLMLMHERGSSIGNKPLFEHDDDHCMPSTSGITSLPCLQRAHPTDTDSISNDHILESRDDIGDDEDTTAGSVERYRYPLHSHSKRIHSESSDNTKDDKEASEESVDLVDARPRKRRAKTDRDPTSP
ncbi:uncharacterized protein LOC121421118 isoform X3 [Lytechinus variegatus]|uniref:uncharacterized protein LOC121421118 isoform X3 n=1 Tax=Lytechinus variegatus TaxID=7654 RepID=UPI001BB0F2A5|nr:uncharacterized protein LOC121421118 isoform X3 [Lytechinus variegatus]